MEAGALVWTASACGPAGEGERELVDVGLAFGVGDLEEDDGGI